MNNGRIHFLPAFAAFLLANLIFLGALSGWLIPDVRALQSLQVVGALVPPYHIVISEFRTVGVSGTSDEFVEIFNPTGESIDLSGWKIMGSDSAGVTGVRYIFPQNTILLPGNHYLIVGSTYSGAVPGEIDAVLTADISDDGGIALTLANELTVIDEVGMSLTSAYKEGAILLPLTAAVDQSYERLPGGSSGSCYDTDDNATDFSSLSPSDPQNMSSPVTVCAGAATATSTSTATATSTASPIPPAHVVISEFRTRGQNGADDEFVEIFNPTGASVNIGGWQIKKSSSCSTTTTTLVTIPAGIILLPGQHFLTATSTSGISGANLPFPASIPDDGGIALIASNGSIVDAVGMCTSTSYLEGPALSPLVANNTQSYERLLGGCVDRDQNFNDFVLLSHPNPQNLSSPATICPGAVTPTPSKTPTATITRTPTRTRTPTPAPTAIPIEVVINELLPHPRTDWNEDGKANFSDEYIEIINVSSRPVNLRGWKLDDGDGGSPPFNLPEIILQPRQIAHFYGSETGILLSDGGDAVLLLGPGGYTADIYNYPVVTRVDITWCRLPDGSGAWTFSCYPSPGRPNVAEVSVPEDERETGFQENASLACLNPGIPAVFVQTECDAPGAGMSNWAMWGSDVGVWLDDWFKWAVIIK